MSRRDLERGRQRTGSITRRRVATHQKFVIRRRRQLQDGRLPTEPAPAPARAAGSPTRSEHNRINEDILGSHPGAPTAIETRARPQGDQGTQPPGAVPHWAVGSHRWTTAQVLLPCRGPPPGVCSQAPCVVPTVPCGSAAVRCGEEPLGRSLSKHPSPAIRRQSARQCRDRRPAPGPGRCPPPRPRVRSGRVRAGSELRWPSQPKGNSEAQLSTNG